MMNPVNGPPGVVSCKQRIMQCMISHIIQSFSAKVGKSIPFRS